MSQPDPAADRRAAQAVVRHHAELAANLDSHTGRLLEAADRGNDAETSRRRDDLVRWLHDELLPHAQAEEGTMYRAAGARDQGRLLVAGMLWEHEAILGLVAELEKATGAVRAAAAARALAALFAVHLAKENELVLPLLADAEDVSLAGLLEGMRTLIGGEESGDAGGCGGACGCGEDARAAGGQGAVLSIDPRLDVRDVPHAQRHARVLAALDALQPDDALVLVAPHAPRPLLAEIDRRYGVGITAEWLQDGPDVWQIRLQRLPATI